MKSSALIDSFSEFRDDKKIDRIALTAILDEVFRTAIKRKFGSDTNFNIVVNPDKGDVQIWRSRVVVEDDDLEDENEEIALSEAKKIEEDFEVGEEVSEEVSVESLGRRAILALRQNLQSRLAEHDSVTLYKYFQDLEGTIITGEVTLARPKLVIVQDEHGNEMMLPKEEQIPTDYFHKGDPIRALIKKVATNNFKTQVTLSRIEPLFLERLFELEIPEVADGVIIVKKAVRIPGEKAKVLVESYDERIDPVGSCVGMKGSRIHGIVRELNNENIDVINYTSNVNLLVSRTLAPAKISGMDINEETKRISVYVTPEEVSKAIGKQGQNIRLASQLVGYEIDIFRDTPDANEDVDLSEFKDEIDEWVIEEFHKIGLDSAKSVLAISKSELIKRTDLEDETIEHVLEVLRKEFED